MDAETLHQGLLLWSGPLNHAHVRELIDRAIATARADGYRAGIEETIKKASEITDAFGHRGLSDLIRALAPAATTEEP